MGEAAERPPVQLVLRAYLARLNSIPEMVVYNAKASRYRNIIHNGTHIENTKKEPKESKPTTRMNGESNEVIDISDSDCTEIASEVDEASIFQDQYVLIESNDDYINAGYKEHSYKTTEEPVFETILAIKGTRKATSYLVCIRGPEHRLPVWVRKTDIKRPSNIEKIHKFKLERLRKMRAEKKRRSTNQSLNEDPQPCDIREDQHELETCILCMVRLKQVVNMPCTHLTCCRICSKQLKECPVCRAKIKYKTAIFFPSTDLIVQQLD